MSGPNAVQNLTIAVDWDGDGSFGHASADVTADVLGVFRYTHGRDPDSVDGITAAVVDGIAVDSTDGTYFPDVSPFGSLIRPGRRIRVDATHGGQGGRVFQGTIGDLSVEVGPPADRVVLPAADSLARLEVPVFTAPIQSGIAPGDAINELLDRAGWPAGDRDIDKGTTALRWWHHDGPAIDGILSVVAHVGPPAAVWIDPSGASEVFVFRDRYHRWQAPYDTNTADLTSAADPTKVAFAIPLQWFGGWRHQYSHVSITVDNAEPQPAAEIDTLRGPIEIPTGATWTFTAARPILATINPVAGVDYTVLAGSGENFVPLPSPPVVGHPVTSEPFANIGSTVTVDRVRLRGSVLGDAAPVTVSAQDTTAGLPYPAGLQLWLPHLTPTAAQQLADYLLARFNQPLRRATVNVDGHQAVNIQGLLTLRQSDLVTVTDTPSGLSGSFRVLGGSATINPGEGIAGQVHVIEQAPTGDTQDTHLVFDDTGPNGQWDRNRLYS